MQGFSYAVRESGRLEECFFTCFTWACLENRQFSEQEADKQQKSKILGDDYR
jgi:hypothetical protein